jgi:hypothetical protein
MGVVDQRLVSAAVPHEKSRYLCVGGWVGLSAGLDKCENSRPTGIRSPNFQACSESLYSLHNPAPFYPG